MPDFAEARLGSATLRQICTVFVLVIGWLYVLRRALILYCFTLPFALVRDFGWGTIPDTLLVAYVFFGIEEIGVEIEDPFGVDDNDLPLERICATIERNLARHDRGPAGRGGGAGARGLRPPRASSSGLSNCAGVDRRDVRFSSVAAD